MAATLQTTISNAIALLVACFDSRECRLKNFGFFFSSPKCFLWENRDIKYNWADPAVADTQRTEYGPQLICGGSYRPTTKLIHHCKDSGQYKPVNENVNAHIKMSLSDLLG